MTTGISEVARNKNEAIGYGYDLFRRVWDFPSASEVDRCLYLIGDCFEWRVGVMRRVCPCYIKLEFGRGSLVVIRLYFIDHLYALVASIANVLLLQGPGIDVLNDPQTVLLQGILHVCVEQVKFRHQGELVLDGLLLDDGGFGWDRGIQTGVGGFLRGSDR